MSKDCAIQQCCKAVKFVLVQVTSLRSHVLHHATAKLCLHHEGWEVHKGRG